jgi:hypothetical protein
LFLGLWEKTGEEVEEKRRKEEKEERNGERKE